MAEVADIIEEHGKPRHVRALATYLQRSSALDDEIRASLVQLSDCLERLGVLDCGLNGYALRATQEIRDLLSGFKSTDDVICCPDDLARLMDFEVENEGYCLLRFAIVARMLSLAADSIVEEGGMVG